MKKLLAVFTTLALLLSMTAMSITTAAEEGESLFDYAVNRDGTATLTAFWGEVTEKGYVDVTIPETIDGKTVTALAESLFDALDGYVRLIEVPATVTTFDDYTLEMANFVRCTAGSPAEAYAQENGLLYIIGNTLYDPFGETETELPVSMAISQRPDQTVFQDGSNYFDLAGLEVTFTYAGDETDTWAYTPAEDEEPFGGIYEDVYRDFPIDVYLDDTQHILEVEYLLCNDSVEIASRPNPVERVEITQYPAPGALEGWTLKLAEKDGRTKMIASDDGTIVMQIGDDEFTTMSLVRFEDADYGTVLATVMWMTEDSVSAFSVTYMNATHVHLMLPEFDVDGQGDGTTIIDALMTLQAAAKKIKLTEEQELIADVDGSGDITAFDALCILQMATNVIPADIYISPDELDDFMNSEPEFPGEDDGGDENDWYDNEVMAAAALAARE